MIGEIKIGTYTGTGSDDIPPVITWREQTKDEALRSCMDSFYFDLKHLTLEYVKQRDAIEARYNRGVEP